MIENNVDNLENDLISLKNDIHVRKISYEESLEISNELINSAVIYFETYHDSQNDDIVAIEDFWQRNYALSESINSSLEIDILIDKIIATNFDDSIELSDIQNLNFLNEIQKQYAIDLLEATKEEDFTKLIELKNNFKHDLREHPELSIYNSGMALVEASELYFQENQMIPFGDCVQSAINGAIMAGVLGMIVGAINGGVHGAIAGLIFTGGSLSVPAGGAGAVLGATWGAITGFIGGFVLTYIGCLIFGN